MCASHLILYALMNLTISAPSISLSISMLFHILHTLSILTRPNILLSICLSEICRLFHLLLLKSKSDEYVTTGLIIILYIFILVFCLGIFILFYIGIVCFVAFCYSFSNFHIHFIISKMEPI